MKDYIVVLREFVTKVEDEELDDFDAHELAYAIETLLGPEGE